MSVAARRTLERVRPSRETFAWGALVVNAELLLLLAYIFAVRDTVAITRPILLVVPFVWINATLWALARVRPAPSGRRAKLVAGAVALGYLLVLAYVGGLVRPPMGAATGLSVDLLALPPGWAPQLFYDGRLLEVTVFPYRLVGYVGLAYLVYVAALDASNALLGGVLGLLSCISCTFPVIAAVVTGVAGGTGGVLNTVTTHGYTLSAVVFVVTVGLLAWRPDPRRLRAWLDGDETGR